MNRSAYFKSNHATGIAGTHRISITRLVITAAVMTTGCLAPAAPDLPVTSNGVAVFQGNQSSGIRSGSGGDFQSPPVTTIYINNLTRDITPSATVAGVNFQNGAGGNVGINLGEALTNVVIRTSGASGVAASSVGTPPSNPPSDPFLGIPVPTSASVPGGVVQVDGYADITTTGDNAHGIIASSRTTGFSQQVIQQLESFTGAGITFTVSQVTNADGSLGTLGQPVTGTLVDSNGVPIAGAGGAFTINANGTYSFNPGTNFSGMLEGETRYATVDYTVHGINSSSVTHDTAGSIVVTVTMTTNGLAIESGTYFPEYGPSANHTSALPDLASYGKTLAAIAEAGGAGNSVTIANHGRITTSGANSFGIQGQSDGGQGGKGRSGSISHSAGAGGAGSAGGNVSITADGFVYTTNSSAVGVGAISRGGNGGQGGDGGFWRYGGSGGAGGDAGDAAVYGSATIQTYGDYSSGVLALSQGGTGGAGGTSDKVFTGGGNGGAGGRGGTVLVDGTWDITTEGNWAHGIWAKSVGGNAGKGGSGGWIAGHPGGGGQATDGGSVTVSSGGVIETFGDDAYGIYSESVGGFGGSGGQALGIFYSEGGDGNSAGSGGNVSVTQVEDGVIVTHGDRSHAIFAQSVGGGGGSGGKAGALVALGGSGASGGNGATVAVTNRGALWTTGTNSMGILAQSIGGGGGAAAGSGGAVSIGGTSSGGGNGGTVVVANIGSVTTSDSDSHAILAQSIGGGGGSAAGSGGVVSIGGSGGAGGTAGPVMVLNSGILRTTGTNSVGILAQSIGGGGGDGAGSGGLVSIGGSGNMTGNNHGGAVTVVNSGAITNFSPDSHAILAQSIGGGGGRGKGSGGLVSLGGDGGAGGNGGAVAVTNSGVLVTVGNNSRGLFAQSIGGGGGDGAGSGGLVSLGGDGSSSGSGSTVAVANSGAALTFGTNSDAILAQSIGGGGGNGKGSGGLVSLGGDGSSSGNGGNVAVDNTGNLQTWGTESRGIFAQSIGGGGGSGAGSGGLVSLGGKGNSSGNGGVVTVTSSGSITTAGTNSHGILAQSIGGGGGHGAGSGGLVSIGGSGGMGGAGAAVSVTNSGQIVATGVNSRGIYAQSVGGGGGDGAGSGGLVSVGGAGSSTGNGAAVTVVNQTNIFSTGNGILAQSVGGGGGSGGGSGGLISIGGSGAAAGDGGVVTVKSGGQIETSEADASGVVAQSIGGGGGNGGGTVAVGAFVSVGVGGSGGPGGDGNIVRLHEDEGSILTLGDRSSGLFAQSVGGGGGNGGFAVSVAIGYKGSVSVGVGGSGGDGGDGVGVTLESGSSVTTFGNDAHGIVAQSVGGGGGSGGFSVAASVSDGVAGAISVGGSGGVGGNAGNVSLWSSGQTINTCGGDSYGLLAQSVGGGGGHGGFSVAGSASLNGTVALSFGGGGGSGGGSGTVDLFNSSTINTWGLQSHGLVAQSVGGGGGSGGFSIGAGLTMKTGSLSMSFGGSGSGGGSASRVGLSNTGDVMTWGSQAYGVLAQSVGGGGGNGGFSVAGAVALGDGVPVTFSMGGSGGLGGSAGVVDLLNQSRVTTYGSNSHGIFAQSLGGGGGNGGFSVAGSLSLKNAAVALSVGGKGGGGGKAERVTVTTSGESVTTFGDSSYGVAAQSIGGGGGNGGFSVAGSLSGASSVNFSLGGAGGAGNSAGAVTITNRSAITTVGTNSHAVFAQSVGGGGGNGGFSVAGTLSMNRSSGAQIALAIGGGGGTGNISGPVRIENEGDILTLGHDSHGIFAQSIGGGGGNGGFAASTVLGAGGGKTELNLAVSWGGGGGSGNYAGAVNIFNNGGITTLGDVSHGIFAQSLGGGGGAGGSTLSGIVSLDGGKESKTINLTAAIGGAGGNGNNGGAVSVVNHGIIDTSGDASCAIFAQSVGGGGGSGGDARTASLVLGKPAIPMTGTSGANKAGSLAVGGSGGGASHGSSVTIQNTGEIITRGADSHGIYAQSIGGGGGSGGDGAHGFSGIDLPFPPELGLIFVEKVKPWNNLSIVVGGSAGSSGNGGKVAITNAANITTIGDGAFGVLAQSIGAGGGVGGNGAIGLMGKVGIGGGGGAAGNGDTVVVKQTGDINTWGEGAHGIFAQSIGGGGGLAGSIEKSLKDGLWFIPPLNVGLGLAWGQDGGSAGNGAAVTIDNTGDIATRGVRAFGIFAQSIGGGGGLAGDAGLGISFAGSVGGTGSGAAVTISQVGDITTLGDYAGGIFAQSGAGTNDFGGKVTITIDGAVRAYGTNSDGVFAQSVGGKGGSDIEVTILNGGIQGGWGTNAGVRMLDGANNTLRNFGAVTTLNGVAGTAVMATGGNDTIENDGLMVGSVDLDGGQNAFLNYSGGRLESGSVINLGSSTAQFINNGTVAPGGAEMIQTTTLTGNYFQTSNGVLEVKIAAANVSDRLAVTGPATLGGTLAVGRFNGFLPKKGDQFTVLTANQGVSREFGALQDPLRGNYAIQLNTLYLPQSVALQTLQDNFLQFSLTPNQRAVAGNLDTVSGYYGDKLNGDPREAALIEYLNTIPGVGLPWYFDLIAPEEFGALLDISVGAADASARNLERRAWELRTGKVGYGNLSVYDPRGRFDWPPGQVGGSADPSSEASGSKDWHLFAIGSGQLMDVGGTANAAGYDIETIGALVGADRLASETFAYGIAAGYVGNRTFLVNGGRLDLNGARFGVYGTWFGENAYLNGAMFGGVNCFDAKRASVGGTARSSTDGIQFDALLGGGYDFKHERLTFGPVASLQLLYAEVNNFTESGSMAPLQIELKNGNSLRSMLGGRIAYELSAGSAIIRPEVQAGWQHEFLDADRAIDARFASGAGNTFRVNSATLGRDNLAVAAGFSVEWTRRFSTSIYYGGQLAREGSTAHSLNIGAGLKF